MTEPTSSSTSSLNSDTLWETADDDALVAAVRRGIDDAFAILIQRYQHRIFSLIHRMLHLPDDTEDMAQEVFVTIYRTIDQFRGECSFSTWSYRIAINLCKNRLKYLQRRNFHRAQSLEDVTEAEFHTPQSIAFANPEQQFLGREMEKILQRELAAIDEEFRLALILRDLDHLSYEEIAAILDLPIGTVKSRIHRARSALKTRMEPYFR